MDHNFNINVTGSGSGGYDSSTQYLVNVLNKLNATLEKLSLNNKNIDSTIRDAKKFSPYDITQKPFQQVGRDFNSAVNDFNSATDRALRDLGNKLGSVLATSALAAVGVTVNRLFNAETTAIMSRASATGVFGGAAIQGNANQSFGSYVSSLFDIERQRQIQRNLALGEGTGGFLGAAGGAVLGGLSALRSGNLSAITGGAASGGAIGVGAGAYATARLVNADVERNMRIRAAFAERDAMAAVTEWKTGFSRFGLERTNRTLVPSEITGGSAITAPLSGAFQSRYGNSQNFNSILNNIVPFLQTNPLDSSKTGNLNTVAQNFLKAGYAAQDFAKLTIQGAQYQALTGKNLESFSDELKRARSKFSDAFDTSTMQNSLNLMAIGYKQDQAQNIAFQSQFNPGMMSSVNQWTHQGISDFYRNQAISKVVGFNINEAFRIGTIDNPNIASKLRSELANIQHGQSPLSQPISGILMASGIADYAKIASLAQNKLTPYGRAINESANLSPAQQLGDNITNMISDGIRNLQTMNVNAQTVNINGNVTKDLYNTRDFYRNEGAMYMQSPTPYTESRSPTKK